METYSDGWEEFKTALANTKKKLLKRPNIRESLPVLKNLALKMSDQDQHAHSALCYMELAIIYKNIGDKINEQEYFAKAARLFGQCQLEMRQCEMRIDSNYGVMMETLYLRTAEASEKDQYHVGIIVCELAHKLIDFEQYWLAFEYLVKANRHLQGLIYMQKIIMDKLILCLTNMDSDSHLADFLTLFTMVLKQDHYVSPIKEKLFEVEVKIVILLCQVYLRDNEIRQRSFLSNYVNVTEKPTVNKDFTLLSDFVKALTNKDVPLLNNIYNAHLWPKLDEQGRDLVERTIARVTPSTPFSRKEINEILEEDISEDEKRKKLFVWYNTVKRRNKQTFQTL